MSSLALREVTPSGRRLVLSEAARAAVEAHAVAGYPDEVVGILAGDRGTGEVTRTAPLQNVGSRGRDRYEVDPRELMRAERALEAQGLQIVGYYHSHPDHPPMYSDTDRDHALPDMAYLIQSVGGPAPRPAGRRCWRLREDRSAMDEDRLS